MEKAKSKLIELIEKYEELRALKEELADSTKEINEELKKYRKRSWSRWWKTMFRPRDTVITIILRRQ